MTRSAAPPSADAEEIDRMSPPTRNGAPPQGPATHKIATPETVQQDQDATQDAGTGRGRVVRVVERTVTATVRVPDAAAARLLRRAATAAGCERGPADGWIVFGSRVERVVSALEAAGYQVQRSTPPTSDATSAGTP